MAGGDGLFSDVQIVATIVVTTLLVAAALVVVAYRRYKQNHLEYATTVGGLYPTSVHYKKTLFSAACQRNAMLSFTAQITVLI